MLCLTSSCLVIHRPVLQSPHFLLIKISCLFCLCLTFLVFALFPPPLTDFPQKSSAVSERSTYPGANHHTFSAKLSLLLPLLGQIKDTCERLRGWWVWGSGDGGWRGGIWTPTQLSCRLRSSPYVKTFRMSLQLSLISVSFSRDMPLPPPAHRKKKRSEDVRRVQKSVPLHGRSSLFCTRLWSDVSRDVAVAEAAHPRYFQREITAESFFLFWTLDGRRVETKRSSPTLFSALFV